MVKISIAVKMIKAAVEITDAINQLKKEMDTTPVAAGPTTQTETPTAAATATPSMTIIMPAAAVPEFEACTCGWNKCRPIDEPVAVTALSITTVVTPTPTPTAPTLTTPTTAMRANAPVFEACPCDGTECCLIGDAAITHRGDDSVRPLVMLAQRGLQDDSELATTTATTAKNDKETDTDELELETSEDEDQVNEIVAQLCHDHAMNPVVLTDPAEDAAKKAADEDGISNHELLVVGRPCINA